MCRLRLRTVSILLFPVIFSVQGDAQTWDNLKILKAGEKIQVVHHTLESRDGTFSSVSDDAISFHVGQQETTVQRANVLRVSSKEHLGRGKKTLIGLGIGAGAGLAIGAIKGDPDRILGRSAYMGVGLGIGMIGGAAVGVALPSKHPTIYRAEPPQNQPAP